MEKRHGRRLDHEERKWVSLHSGVCRASLTEHTRRKRTAREAHKASAETQTMFGHKAKLHHAKRHSEKVQMKKTLKAYDERDVKQKDDGPMNDGDVPGYMFDREEHKVRLVSLFSIARLSLTWVGSGRKSTFVRDQGPTKRPRCKVFCTITKGPGYRRGGDVQSDQDGETQGEELEADGEQGDVCWGELYAETGQIGAVHPTDGLGECLQMVLTSTREELNAFRSG